MAFFRSQDCGLVDVDGAASERVEKFVLICLDQEHLEQILLPLRHGVTELLRLFLRVSVTLWLKTVSNLVLTST